MNTLASRRSHAGRCNAHVLSGQTQAYQSLQLSFAIASAILMPSLMLPLPWIFCDVRGYVVALAAIHFAGGRLVLRSLTFHCQGCPDGRALTWT